MWRCVRAPWASGVLPAALLRGVVFHAQLDVRMELDSCKELVLDTRGLGVHSVDLLEGAGPAHTHQPLDFHFGQEHKALGVPLHVKLPDDRATDLRLGVRFTTSPTSSAVQVGGLLFTPGTKCVARTNALTRSASRHDLKQPHS